MPRNARTAAAPAANTVATPTTAALEAQIAALTAELRESEERHERIIAAVAEGIYDWDIETNALAPSPRLIEIFGFRGRELRASDWNVLVHPDDFPRYRDALRDCFRGTRRGWTANTASGTATAPIAGSRTARCRCATPPAARFG